MPDNRLSARNKWFRVWMPYCFEGVEAPGAKHVYLALNRNYKPLGYGGPRGTGIGPGSFVEYKDFLHQALVFSRDPTTFAGVWVNTEPHLYLYDDGTESQATYFERLEKLMSRAVGLYPFPDPNDARGIVSSGAGAIEARMRSLEAGRRFG